MISLILVAPLPSSLLPAAQPRGLRGGAGAGWHPAPRDQEPSRDLLLRHCPPDQHHHLSGGQALLRSADHVSTFQSNFSCL